jgi:hypothetical protein
MLEERKDQLKADGKINVLPELPSKRTYRRILKEAEITNTRTAQIHKKARVDAGNDMRMFVSQASISLATLQPDSSKEDEWIHFALRGNFDKASYLIQRIKRKVVITLERAKLSGSQPITKMGKSSLGHTVHVYDLITANGRAYFVWVIAHRSLPEGEVLELKLVGMGQSPGDTSKLFLVKDFTKNNHIALCRKLLHEFLGCMKKQQQLVREQRKAAGLATNFDAPGSGGVLFMDGEEAMLEVATTDDNLRAKAAGLNLLLSKFSPSLTHYLQACDSGRGHMYTRRQLVKFLRMKHPYLVASVKAQLKRLGIKGEVRKRVIEAVEVLPLPLNASYTVPTVKEGFEISGIAPYDRDRILSFCDMEVSEEDFQTCQDAVAVLAEWVRDGHYITEEKLDDMNIPKSEKEKKSRLRRDELKDSSQRALIINDGSLQTLRVEQAAKRKIEAEKNAAKEEKKAENKKKREEKAEKEKEMKRRYTDALKIPRFWEPPRADDVFCANITCGVSYYRTEAVGLIDLAGENCWVQCEYCKEWVCCYCNYNARRGAITHHEKACKASKKGRRGT